MKAIGSVLFWLLTALGYGIVIGWFVFYVWSAANFISQPFPG